MAMVMFVYVFVFWILLPAFLLAIGFRLDNLLSGRFDPAIRAVLIGWALVILGVALMLAAMTSLWWHGRGLPISHLPPTRLVRVGVYKYFRHPTYIGYTVVFAGAALLLGSTWTLAASTPLLLIGWFGYTTFYEDPILKERYGDPYRAYRAATVSSVLKQPLVSFMTRLEPFLRICSGSLNKLANWTILYRRGNLILVAYGLFIALGSLLFTQHLATLLLAQGVPATDAVILLISGSIATFLLARAFSVAGHWRQLLPEPVTALRRVGVVSWGGFFGMILATWAFARSYNYPFLLITDAVVRGIFIGWAVGRIGCITYGCCYGLPSNHYGVLYSSPDAKVIREKGRDQIPRHPIPLYSFILNITLFFIVNLLASKSLPTGFITGVAFVLYAIGRSYIEFFRDSPRHVHGILTSGHLGCIVMFLTGWLLLFTISPSIDAYAPKQWSCQYFIESLTLLPTVLIISIGFFVAASFHWKKVGTW